MPTFGPMYENWNEDQVKQACLYISLIVINAKNEI
jgi:hypothetical protein